MKSSAKIKAIIEGLESTKVKERQDAIISIRELFAQDSVVDNYLQGKPPEKVWLPVLAAIFTCVRLETADTFDPKKSTGTAEKRLTTAATTVRWFLERIVHRLNKKVLVHVFEFLIKSMKRNGKLLLPVALDFIKALECVASYTPHLERMEQDTWGDVVQIAFNVILRNPLNTPLHDDLDQAPRAPSPAATDNSEMYVDDFSLTDEGDADVDVPAGKKRKRPTPQSSHSRAPQPPTRFRKTTSVTAEQVACISLLTVLLKSNSAPILEKERLSEQVFAPAIIRHLQTFLEIYPNDTSLHHYYLQATLATLEHVALNRKDDVMQFAINSWDRLLGLWGTKNKNLKEGLVSVLRILFPFFTAGSDAEGGNSDSWSGGLHKLWNLTNGEAESKWGVEALSLDAIRLEVLGKDRGDVGAGETAFRAKTFRAGVAFDSNQALTWATLELQADCAEKLFQHSESIHSQLPPSQSTQAGNKRVRMENPLSTLLQSIRSRTSSALRAYELQLLLFFIDRHWSAIHDTVQAEIISTLSQFLSSDDGNVQNWTFLCFAAVAYTDCNDMVSSRPSPILPMSPVSSKLAPIPPRGATTWDPVWTHAIRRTNSSPVCRAASHAASALLMYANAHSSQRSFVRSPLTSHRVLSEIETLAKDLDVQGPTGPYDSVCIFFSLCLKVANQDVRLYRMQLEEKVLAWLVDSWKPEQISSEASQYLPNDILLLLETICACSQRSSLISRILLPHCLTTETLLNKERTRVIREFLLDAKLPPFENGPARSSSMSSSTEGPPHSPEVGVSAATVPSETDLIEPRGRERKISAFLLRSLDTLIPQWQQLMANISVPRAAAARKALDLAVISLSFESVLTLDGIRGNRRVILAACKLVGVIAPLLNRSQCSMEEKSSILVALEPLISVETQNYDDAPWSAMLPPSASTGIRAQTLKSLLSDGEERQGLLRTARTKHLKVLWQNAEVQSTFSNVSDILRNVLRVLMGQAPKVSDESAMNVDDSFVTPQIKERHQGFTHSMQPSPLRRVADVCITFLSVAPILQQTSGEQTRDKELTELMLDCAETDSDSFLLVCPAFFEQIRNQTLNLNPNHLGSFIDRFATLMTWYAYAKSEVFILRMISFLDSTLHLWTSSTLATTDMASRFRQLVDFCSRNLLSRKLGSWKLRDLLARLYDRYLLQDPHQKAWLDFDEEKEAADAKSPKTLLQKLSLDPDIRVRFRAAISNARLFEVAKLANLPLMVLYEDVRNQLAVNTTMFEHIITRIICLGNIMVVSSAVRRGPYWHLLETCLHTDEYNKHLEAILAAVSQRMGFTKLSDLFGAYASQIAYSLRLCGKNVMSIPSHLLGFKDRKERALETLRAFTPTNILSIGAADDKHGRLLFEGHCKVIQKSPEEAIRECFGDIVGFQALALLDATDVSPQVLEDHIMHSIDFAHSPSLRETLKDAADSVAASIIRTLNVHDFTENGAIVRTFRDEHLVASAQVFVDMTRHRHLGDIDTHEPNLPSFSPKTILKALSWLTGEVPGEDTHALTYHVMQELFADVQRTLLVNEQIRLINAICLWVAYRHPTTSFKDATLLHMLFRGACSLLGQQDLVPAAQSILDWTFGVYRSISGDDPRFPDILIHVACQCQDHAVDADPTPAAQRRGAALLEWIEEQAYSLSQVPGIAEQVKLALPAWPREPSASLSPLFDAIDSYSLSKILTDQHISSNKFRLVRRIRDYAQQQSYDHSQFAQSDFWKLKECIPAADQLREEDVHAFASLLVLTKGSISSFGSEPSVSEQSSKDILQKKGKGKGKKDCRTSESSLILILLNMLENNDGDGARHAAYRTLRSLLVTMSAESIEDLSTLWPLEYRDEVSYLKEFRHTPGSRKVPDLAVSLASAEFIEGAQDFSNWVSLIATLLSDVLSASNRFYAQLYEILASHAGFAQKVLPILVETFLQSPEGSLSSPLLSRYFEQLLTSSSTAESCRRSIIDIVLHLRHIQPTSENAKALDYNKWLDLSFLSLARNAITCGAYTTALLFLELEAEYTKGSANVSTEEIMYEIYSNIDEPDGFYAIRTQDHHQFLIRRFHHENEWEKAFRFHGAALETDTGNAKEIEGLLQSLHSYGFNHVATRTLLDSDQDTNPSMAYQLGWRAETWDLPESKDDRHPGASLYLALRAVHRERDQKVTDAVIRHVLYKEMEHLRTLGSENVSQIRDVVQTLMSLSQAKQWRGDIMQKLVEPKSTDLDQWSGFATIETGFQFADIESIMATRISLIKSARQKELRQQIGSLLSPFAQTLLEVEKRCLLHLSKAATDSHQTQVALNSVIRAKKLEQFTSFSVTEEFASVLWSHGEEKHAVEYLKDLRQSFSNPDPVQLALITARLGTWTAEACLEQPSFITDEFFRPAKRLMDSFPQENEARATVYHQFAKFSETQYQAALDSPDLIRLKVYKERKEIELQKYEQMDVKHTEPDPVRRKQLYNHISSTKKILSKDNKAVTDFIANRDAFLCEAIRMYSLCLQTSDAFDEEVPIRLCSLWLSNFDNEAVERALTEGLKSVPSRKLVFLAHQLFSRIDGNVTQVQKLLRATIFRMCDEHPFHSLYQLYCLQPAEPIEANTARRTSGRVSASNAADTSSLDSETNARSEAAKKILARLLNDPKCGERTRAVQELCQASLQFANYSIKQLKLTMGQKYPVPKEQLLYRLSSNALKVPVITAYTPIDPTTRYDPNEYVCVAKYASHFETLGGINLPKVLVCIGSDGGSYKQLFKGDQKDDLRQDAVMEQVFDLVNIVLRRDVETRRRNLYVRGYKVIPLASQAGIIEFVGNTTTLKTWLERAHPRYNPDDHKRIVSMFSDFHNKQPRTNEEKVEFYLDRLKGFHPVMRHYFTENHKTPIAWFRTRLNYTRSVATTSIVGHVLGLGDRHTSNILMDNSKGEVIHIDLGVAFDQGKLLPIPENVPFRMTPDMVDGMGISGTNGVFQRCAEETLRVFRDGSEVIMTVLQVFRHDPLHNWTVSDRKIKKQVEPEDTATTTMTALPKDSGNERLLSERLGIGINMDSTHAQEDADRALIGVSSKLSKTLSVAAAVRTLVAEATDPRNLGTIYCGWGPYY